MTNQTDRRTDRRRDIQPLDQKIPQFEVFLEESECILINRNSLNINKNSSTCCLSIKFINSAYIFLFPWVFVESKYFASFTSEYWFTQLESIKLILRIFLFYFTFSFFLVLIFFYLVVVELDLRFVKHLKISDFRIFFLVVFFGFWLILNCVVYSVIFGVVIFMINIEDMDTLLYGNKISKEG